MLKTDAADDEAVSSSSVEEFGVDEEVGPAKVVGSSTVVPPLPSSGAFDKGQNNSRVSSSSSSTAASSAPVATVSPALSSSSSSSSSSFQSTAKRDASSGEVARLLEENQSLRQV
jgi:hypothetical protein